MKIFIGDVADSKGEHLIQIFAEDKKNHWILSRSDKVEHFGIGTNYGHLYQMDTKQFLNFAEKILVNEDPLRQFIRTMSIFLRTIEDKDEQQEFREFMIKIRKRHYKNKSDE